MYCVYAGFVVTVFFFGGGVLNLLQTYSYGSDATCGMVNMNDPIAIRKLPVAIHFGRLPLAPR